MFNWKPLFAELGWAMAIADPTCYWYYLASRVDSTRNEARGATPTHDDLPQPARKRIVRDRWSSGTQAMRLSKF